MAFVDAPAPAMTLRDRWAALARNRLVRSVGVLVGGTAFAHAITAATLPIVTRLYTPADFSVLAVFASLLSIVSVAACLRFDVAIPIPEHDAEAVNLLALALGCTAIIALVLALALMVAPTGAIALFKQPGLAPWLWLLPFGVVLTGGYSALQMWFVRKKEFGSIARSRVTQSAAASATQVGMGWLHWAPVGLILGQMLNTGAGCIALGYRFVTRERDTLRSVSATRMRSAFAAYDRFPKYSTFEALSNSASIQLPIILIAALAIGPEAGYLVLAMSAMQAPMGLIGTAVSQVYLSRAPEEHRAGRLDSFTADVFGALVKSGVGPLILAGFVAPDLFAFVFGAPWRRAGVLVAWMTPWFIMQFLSVPVSMALHVTGRQRAALALQLFGLTLRVGAVLTAAALGANLISEAYALSGFVFYFVYLAIVLRVVDAKPTEVVREVVRALPILAGWTVAGWMLSMLIDALPMFAR
jgi:O-antigen/teichoic acid export membrane protein